MLFTRKRQTFLTALIAFMCGSIAACQPTPTLASPTVSGIGVGITDEDPCPNVGIQPGQQVAWTNQDDEDHIVRVRAADGTVLFDSGTLKSGDSFAYTFQNAGDYTYECSDDGSMTGIVTVQP